MIRSIAAVLGKEEKAKKVIARIDGDMKKVEVLLKGNTRKPNLV
jgi:ABC-type Fe3+-hydroxamate transport system substrate-binding protein